jgi:hypothetical protein
MSVPEDVTSIIDSKIKEMKGSSKLILKEQKIKDWNFRKGAEWMFLVLEEVAKVTQEAQAELDKEDVSPVLVDL